LDTTSFDVSHTSTEQRFEFVVSYLTHKAIQWCGGFSVITLPWYKFCSYITKRFSEKSICDNVKAFHSLNQTRDLNEYVEEFERMLNLVRRDNLNLPSDYYVNCFIAGLSDYI